MLPNRKPVDWSDFQPDPPSQAIEHIFSALSKPLPNPSCLHLPLLLSASLFKYEDKQMKQVTVSPPIYLLLLLNTVTHQQQSKYKTIKHFMPVTSSFWSQGTYKAATALICCQGLQAFPASQGYIQSAAHSLSRNFRKAGLFYFDYLFEGSWQGRRNFPLGHSSVPEGVDGGVQYVYGICHHFNGIEQLLQVTEGWCVISYACRPSSCFATAEWAGTKHLQFNWGKPILPFLQTGLI